MRELAIVAVMSAIGVAHADEPTFRTDSSKDESLPWFQLVDGEFPPEGSAHYFAGELTEIDHVNRTGTLRIDRTDKQSRSHWDLPVDFELLPYGSVRYHGAPAALKDVPLGTHLHGWFFLKAPEAEGTKSVFHNRRSLEADFTRCLRLEDDFSRAEGLGRGWRVEAVDLEARKLTVVGVPLDGKGEPDAKPTTFDLTGATRIWKGRAIGGLGDLAAGQVVQVNLTWATLFGPGRLTDVWIDEESRRVATDRQRAVHRLYQRERGLAGWIDEVDNQKRIVTMTIFGGVDPELLGDLKPKTSVTVVVAEPTLRTYDPVNDRKGGPLLEVLDAQKQPGSSGVRIRFQPSLLLEGFRPGKVIRVFPSGWNVVNTPLEERLWPARD